MEVCPRCGSSGYLKKGRNESCLMCGYSGPVKAPGEQIKDEVRKRRGNPPGSHYQTKKRKAQ